MEGCHQLLCLRLRWDNVQRRSYLASGSTFQSPPASGRSELQAAGREAAWEGRRFALCAGDRSSSPLSVQNAIAQGFQAWYKLGGRGFCFLGRDILASIPVFITLYRPILLAPITEWTHWPTVILHAYYVPGTICVMYLYPFSSDSAPL